MGNFFSYIVVQIITLLRYVISFLPDPDTGVITNIQTSWDTLINLVGTTGAFFNVTALFAVLAAFLVLETSILLFLLIRYVVKNVSLGHLQ